MSNNGNPCTPDEVLALLFKEWKPTASIEPVMVEESFNRISDGDVFSVNTLPVCRSSQMDGVAFSYDLWQAAKQNTEHWRIDKEFVRADTGDDFPDEYDTVLPIEDVTITAGGGLVIGNGVNVVKGGYISPRGKSLQAGDLLVRSGQRIRATDMANLASGGIRSVVVRKKPIVSFIPTGTELVMSGIAPERGQNVDSNSVMAKPVLEQLGAKPIMYPITKDNKQSISQALELALERSDIVIINAGSSMGDEDFGPELLKDKGQILCQGVAAVPGRPMSIALIGNKPVINLPGPGMAAFFGLYWCVNAVIAHYLMISPLHLPSVKAVLANDMPTAPKYMNICKLALRRETGGSYCAEYIPLKDVRSPVSMGSNAMYVSPIGESMVEKGRIIDAMLLCNPSELDLFFR